MGATPARHAARVWRSLRAAVLLVPVVPSFMFADAASEAALPHLQTGLAYERLGRFTEAYTELQLASNLDPNNVQTAVALGVVANRLGHYDEGQRALEHSIALDGSSCASYYELALLYEKKGLTDRALESWDRFLALTQDQALKALAQKHVAYLQGHP